MFRAAKLLPAFLSLASTVHAVALYRPNLAPTGQFFLLQNFEGRERCYNTHLVISTRSTYGVRRVSCEHFVMSECGT